MVADLLLEFVVVPLPFLGGPPKRMADISFIVY